MSILNVEHLSHGFGDRAIFEDGAGGGFPAVLCGSLCALSQAADGAGWTAS